MANRHSFGSFTLLPLFSYGIMSVAIVHFAVGFGTTVLLWTAFKGRETQHMLPILLGGGLYAMIPDLHHILPVLSGPYNELLHNSNVAYIFMFHRGFDILDPNDTIEVAALALVYLTLCILVREAYLYKTV